MTKPIIGVLLAIGVFVGGYFVLQGVSGGSNTANVSTSIADIAAMGTTGTETAQGEPTVMNFANVLRQGGSYKCEVDQDVLGTATKSTIYISNGKASGEFKTKIKGVSADTRFIMRDGVSYTWNSATPKTGFSADTTTDITSSTKSSASGTYYWDVDQVGGYNCAAWRPDEAKFIIPDTINFKTIGA